ncbi:restriction endonuclease subunit S [Oceanivirga salmonicida]|uniref:restriction endonuclease subunit S n=1 Tax=Oceanivirga salmonicida TaxID=1769291 RepID=UPI000AFB8BF9|nr:restriction endonuclease subunit S [Oceanivirga salmonicida]
MKYKLKKFTLSEISVGNKGNYGISASAIEFSNDLPTYLRISDISDDGTLNKNKMMSIDDDNASKYILKKDDIVFARTGGSTGRNYFHDSEEEYIYAGFLIKFSIDKKKVNPKYIKYYCQSKEYYNWIYSFKSGSTRGNINAKTLGELPIFLPERIIQNKTVEILRYLDKKIELNNKINDNLEQQAQAIFKSWFNNSEPNGKLKDIILENPKSKIKVGDVKKNNGQYPFFTSGQSILSYSFPLVNGRNCFLNTGGNADVKFYIGKASYSTDTWCIFAKNKLTDYLFLLLLSIKNEINDQYFEGSALKHLQKKSLKNKEIYIPFDNEIIEFNKLIIPVFDNIINNKIQNKKLSLLRDSLLPKLMSGEIDVSNIAI